ncbi:hypothetical protein NKJ26_27780 [Mesorhizobium sp. M0152]|uniref:hypothetical protein n=1 Tax=Mesorhizobium sp. M0152 TaxID=2956898 RepID=UPI00333AD09C
MRNRSAFAAIVLTAMMPVQSTAQEAEVSAPEKIAGIVVLDGPYELAGGVGVLGYVLKRTGQKVDFQPCVGPVLSIDGSRLKPTALKCDDEPSTKPHPFNVACNTIASQVAVLAQVAGENPKDAPVGTVYLKGPTDEFTKTLPTPGEGWGQWNAALTAPVAVCGDSYVFLPNVQAKAWIGIIKGASQ